MQAPAVAPVADSARITATLKVARRYTHLRHCNGQVAQPGEGRLLGEALEKRVEAMRAQARLRAEQQTEADDVAAVDAPQPAPAPEMAWRCPWHSCNTCSAPAMKVCRPMYLAEIRAVFPASCRPFFSSPLARTV